jgi:membrane-associated phospholipid phosphatase
MNGLDQYLALALNRSIEHWPLLDWFVGTVLDLPSLKMLPLVAMLGAIWFSAPPKAPERRIVLQTVIGAMLALVVSRLMQDIGPYRPRPMHLTSLGFTPPLGIHPERVEHSSSFPSDHAALALALSAGIYLWRRSLGAAAIVWSLATTCFARVYAGYHYPTDVVVGALLGVAATWAAGMMPLMSVQAFLERQAVEHPYLFYFISFCVAYEVVSLFWDFRFAATNLQAILHS